MMTSLNLNASRERVEFGLVFAEEDTDA
jgi:hypothetical protein